MTGRPTVYSEELGDRVCLWLEEGNSLRSLCQQEDMPQYGTIMRWLREKRQPFSDNYACARRSQAHNDADRMNEIIAKVERGELKPDQGRVMMDGLKWTAGRRDPRTYGDKLALSGDEDSGPIQVTWASPSTK